MPKPAKNGFLLGSRRNNLATAELVIVCPGRSISGSASDYHSMCRQKAQPNRVESWRCCLESRRANKWKASRHCPHPRVFVFVSSCCCCSFCSIFAACAFDFCGSALHSSRSIICYGIPSVCLLIPHVNQAPNYSLNAKDNWPFRLATRQKDINFNMESSNVFGRVIRSTVFFFVFMAIMTNNRTQRSRCSRCLINTTKIQLSP